MEVVISQENLQKQTLPIAAELSECIPDEEWEIYQRVLRETRAQGIRVALGGGIAVSLYTGQWRNTKDLDLYILHADREAMIAALTRAGLSDYYDQKPYDRNWIYRSVCEGIIVDAIWAMANGGGPVDEAWVMRGPEVRFRGERLRMVPPEDLIWSKLHILQRDRCDWPDVLNLIFVVGPALDWERLLARLQEDAPLLGAVLLVFTWLCPGRAQALPSWLWSRLRLPAPPSIPASEWSPHCIDRLDSRSWFCYPAVDDPRASSDLTAEPAERGVRAGLKPAPTRQPKSRR